MSLACISRQRNSSQGSNRDLENAMKAGQFYQELFFAGYGWVERERAPVRVRAVLLVAGVAGRGATAGRDGEPPSRASDTSMAPFTSPIGPTPPPAGAVLDPVVLEAPRF